MRACRDEPKRDRAFIASLAKEIEIGPELSLRDVLEPDVPQIDVNFEECQWSMVVIHDVLQESKYSGGWVMWIRFE